MITQSPNFKLNPMTPLSVHHKLALIEDEPDDLELEQGYSKIQFNERLIVCMYKPHQIVTNIQKTLLKLKGQSNIGWVNPILKDEKVRSSSILKCSQSPIRICSVSQ